MCFNNNKLEKLIKENIEKIEFLNVNDRSHFVKYYIRKCEVLFTFF